jgi:hypothetical protein
LVKYGGIKLLNRIMNLEGGNIPEEREETIVVTIHKSGDRDRCEN